MGGRSSAREAGCWTEFINSLRKHYFCKKGARCESGCTACCFPEQGCQQPAEAMKAVTDPPGTFVMLQALQLQKKPCSNWADPYTCTHSMQHCRITTLQRDRMCRITHTHTQHAEIKLCRNGSLWLHRREKKIRSEREHWQGQEGSPRNTVL